MSPMHWCKGGLCCAAIFVEAAVGAGGASDVGTVVLSKHVADALLQGWTMLRCDFREQQLELEKLAIWAP